MTFIADLHIHSRFSRATSKQLNPRHLAAWARCKGIHVLGTGDFTHPQWRQELRDMLVRDDTSGLYRLKDAPEALDFLGGAVPGQGDGPLFLLQTEISSIYKRHGRVRKVHNLVFVPTLEDADRLSARLENIGNLHSDGRPILGLDSRDLLELCLDVCPRAVLVPAHVWTPWFALFGSKSGFDRLEDCFDDLSSHIFALETGLSSDPAMNRLVSRLDGYALISNSDAHSGANLGREANLFDGQPGYDALFAALRATARREPQDGLDCRFLGTLEFYPEEGKYHLDGHRACQVVMEPREALACNNICPVCGKPLTIGVLHRVWELADRETPPELPREPRPRPLIPLPEVVGELLGAGASSRRVQERYARLLTELGPDLDILCRLPEDAIRQHWDLLGEAVSRMRRGQVFRQGGYDGEYGVVRVFSPDEAEQIHGRNPRGTSRRGRPSRQNLSLLPERPTTTEAAPTAQPSAAGTPATEGTAALRAFRQAHDAQPAPRQAPDLPGLSEEQEAALRAGPEPVLVLAGPGAGKTRVLIGRLQHLMAQGLDPASLLAVTFTRRAASELRQRLRESCGQQTALPACDTLHALAWEMVRQAEPQAVLLTEQAARELFRQENPHLSAAEAQAREAAYSLWREQEVHGRALPPDADELPLLGPSPHVWLADARRYTRRKQQHQPRLYDYADLLDALLRHARTHEGQYRHVLVDEIQDLSPKQLAVVQALLPGDGCGFFGIGDPDQAIYGFRGVSGQSEASVRRLWPALQVFRLGRSYRAGQPILDSARRLLQDQGQCGPLTAAQPLPTVLHLFAAPDAAAEARWVARRVGHLLGATAHSLLDQQKNDEQTPLDGTLTPGDIAVLVRVRAQIPLRRQALEARGIPCSAPSGEHVTDSPFCRGLLLAAARICGLADMLPPSWAEETAADPRMQDMSWLEEHLTSAPGTPLPPEALGRQLSRCLHRSATQDALEWHSPSWRTLLRLWQEQQHWPDVLQALVWEDEAERLRARAEQVQIMTLHASKGLEFRAVFLPGLEDGLLPLRRNLLTGQPEQHDSQVLHQQEEEERRLLYVGITRASQAVFASHCARRQLYGHQLSLAPSPFVALLRDYFRQSTLRRHVKTTQQHLSLLS